MRKLFFFTILYLLKANSSVFSQAPIKVERTISFTTQEGSNMSVDISPDGKTIVFDLLGDLYTVPVKGGNATQITRGIAVNSYPVWNSKSDRIAYVSDGTGEDRLTVLNLMTDGIHTFSNPVLGFPIWVKDNWLTSSYWFPYGYPLYHLSDGQVKLPKDLYDIVGSSNENELIYYKKSLDSGKWALQQFDKSTGIRKSIAEFDLKTADGIKVSKDAHWMSYLIREGISCSLLLVDLSTKKEKILARWEQNVPANLVGHYGYSSDSKKIVIAYGGKIHLIELETGKDEIVPFKADVQIALGKLNEAKFKVSQEALQVKYMRSAHSSPNGKQLVFSALNRIYIMDLPNGKPRILVNQPFNQFHPSWSTDGKWITFASWSDKDFGQVWKVDPNGRRLMKVTQVPGAYHYPSLSPDGKSIIVSKANFSWEGKPYLVGRVPGLGKLLSVSLKEGEVTTIADSIQIINRAVYTVDGQAVVYKPQLLKGDGEYWPSLIVKNGIQKKVLALTIPEPGIKSELFLQQIALSSNGKYIVYQNEENLYLMPVAPTGMPPLLYDRNQKLPVIRFARGGIDPHWLLGGKLLSWSFANQYFQIDPEKIVTAAINAAEKRAESNRPQPEILDVDITPDKILTIDLKAPQKIGKGLLALKNVRIISMKSAQVIEKGTVLIKDGRILEVGKLGEVKIPTKVKVVDLTGKTIIPGLIDLHDHVRAPGGIFPQQKRDFLAGLAYGTTTAREPAGTYDCFGYEELLATGQMIGPRLFNVGHAVTEERYPNIKDLEEAKIIVKNRTRMDAIAVKQYSQSTRLKRQLLLLACDEGGVNMTNEVEQDMRGFIGQLKDGSSGVEHNPRWGEIYQDVIQLVAKSGTYLTPTLQALFGTQPAKYEFTEYFTKLNPKLTRFYPEKEIVRRSLQKLNVNPNEPSFLNHSKIDAAIRYAGGRVTMGSHGEDPGLGAHFEIWALQMGGLTNMEALESATIMAAGALGMQNDLGSIEPGKIADLIILNENPLDNIRNTIEIQSVMKDGVLYDGNTLDEIWPVKKKFKYTKSNY